MTEETSFRMTRNAVDFLERAGKWAHFVASWIFVWVGLSGVSGLLSFLHRGDVLDLVLTVVTTAAPAIMAVYMNRFSKKIKDMSPLYMDGDLEGVLESLFKFWKLVGIIIICYIALFVIVLLTQVAGCMLYR